MVYSFLLPSVKAVRKLHTKFSDIVYLFWHLLFCYKKSILTSKAWCIVGSRGAEAIFDSYYPQYDMSTVDIFILILHSITIFVCVIGRPTDRSADSVQPSIHPSVRPCLRI